MKNTNDNTIPPLMEDDDRRYDVGKKIWTSEEDWTELRVITGRYKSMGAALHDLIKFYKRFHSEEPTAQKYDNVAAGYSELEEKAGLKI